jgi:methylmalonyl-CoA mutase cobalamin-binding subunit
MQHVLAPLIQRIGDAWEAGELRVAHEHMASAVIRTMLGNFVRVHSETSNPPALLVTTPSGQLHELGALLAAATAADQGWRVIYLGPNLPPEEIAGAYAQNRADALAISIVYPGDDPSLVSQLRLLRRLLPAEAVILAGGRAASGYGLALKEAGVIACACLTEFVCALNKVRRKRAAKCCEKGESRS